MLIKRLLTALLLVPTFVLAIYLLPSNYFQIIIAIITFLGAIEWLKLSQLNKNYQRIIFFATLAILAYVAILLPLLTLVITLCWWCLNAFLIFSYPKNQSIWQAHWGLSIINGTLLLVPMWLAISLVYQENGANYIMLLMLLIWAADTGAYFIGKSFGKHKLMSKVSPGKTIEGALGALLMGILAMLVFILLNGLLFWSVQTLYYICFAVLIVIISIVGDLYESLFKRWSNLKDSGNILPGHGGILDRVDSLTAAAPLFSLLTMQGLL